MTVLPGVSARRHDDVLRRHHARLVEEDVRAAQAVCAHLVEVAGLDVRAEVREAVDVRVEPSPPDDVASGRRGDHVAAAHEERAGQQERGSHLRAQLPVELCLPDLGGLDAHLVRAGPLDVGADVDEERQHRVDVADPRDVSQRHRLARQQAGGEDREHSVLVPGSRHVPVQGLPALDDEGLHQLVLNHGLSHWRRAIVPLAWRSPASAPGRP